MRTRRCLCSLLAAGMLGAAPAGAQAPRTDDARGGWMLALGAQADEADSDSLFGTVFAAVGPRTWLTFAAGRSSSPADRADVEASALSLGIDQRFDGVGFTLQAERWGDAGVLETEELGGSVYIDRDRWRIGVGYDARDIEIPFTVTGPLGGVQRRTADVSAASISIDARIALGERWQLYAALTEHDYERDLALLPRIERLNLLSASTLTLANSFLSRERSLAVERELGAALLNVRVATDRSAIDGSKLDTVEAAVLFPLSRRIDLEVNLGRGRSDLFDPGLYGGVLFLFYGG